MSVTDEFEVRAGDPRFLSIDRRTLRYPSVVDKADPNALENALARLAEITSGPALPSIEALRAVTNPLPALVREREERVRVRAEYDAKTIIIRQLGHDLRTPLSQVAKYAYLIEHDPQKPLPEKDLRMEGIKRGLNRMGDLIRQIRELRSSHVEANEWRSLKGEALEIVRSFWKMNDLVNERGMRLVLEEGGSPLVSNVSFIHLFQILDNLLLNAVDAIAERKNGTVRIAFYDDRDGSRLVVSDDGVGIATPDVRRILEVDYTTKVAKGTGLGLAIVRRICGDYGLGIGIESRPGEGTSFTVRFPRTPHAVDTNLREGRMNSP